MSKLLSESIELTSKQYTVLLNLIADRALQPGLSAADHAQLNRITGKIYPALQKINARVRRKTGGPSHE